MASTLTYFGILFLGMLVRTTCEITTTIPTKTMLGVTSVVASPSTVESKVSFQGSVSVTSTQALAPTTTSTREVKASVKGSISSSSTQVLLPASTSESMTTGSIRPSSTQAPAAFTSTINPVTTGIPYSKPVIVQGLKDVTVREGMELVMKCKATGYPQPYFVWQKENIELKNTSRILIKHDNSLTILNTTREDAGQYECIARNAAGLESASTAVVKVIYISDVNITTDKTVPVHEGTDIKLTCSVHSHPRVFFTWTRNGRRVDGYMIQITVRNGFYVGVLHRRQIKREMGGNYTCLAQSYDGGLSITASKLLHVRLASKPTYPPLEEIVRTAHTIKVPIHNIEYLGNGKKVRQIQVIVQQLEDNAIPKKPSSTYGPDELGPFKGNTAKPYIAAVLNMDDKKHDFVLGDDHVYYKGNGSNKVEYRNVPLHAEQYYTAFQRLVSEDNDHESLDWIQPIKTSPETQNTTPSNLGLILGLIFGLLVVGVLMAFFVWKIIFQKKPKSSENASTDALEMYPEREVFEPPPRPRRPVHF